MKDHHLNFLLCFAIVSAVCVCISLAITVDACKDRRAALASERAAWQQTHELRATMAAQGLAEQF